MKQTCRLTATNLPPPRADSYVKFTKRILLGLQAFKDRQEIFKVSKGIYNVASFCDSLSTSLSIFTVCSQGCICCRDVITCESQHYALVSL